MTNMYPTQQGLEIATCSVPIRITTPNPLGHSDERTDSDIKLAY